MRLSHLFIIKFQKGAALPCQNGCSRAAFHIGEQNECQYKLLRCYHPAAQNGGIRTLREKGSGQNCCPDRKTDRCGYYTFDINIFNYHYVSREYTPDCMHRRNRHLVDHSGTCICYLTKTSGGTAYTVDYARRKRLRIINLAAECHI